MLEALLKKNFDAATQRVKPLDLLYEQTLSQAFSQEDAPLARTLYRARVLAEVIVGGDKVTAKQIEQGLALLEPLLSYRFVNDGFDQFALRRMQKLLLELRKNGKLIALVNGFSKDVANTHVEYVVLRSVGKKGAITDALVREAVVSALLMPLRQNVGSCFATAPCIIIQDEQVENLLHDLGSLVHGGVLRRVVAGKEIAVPLSLSTGAGIAKKRLPASYCNKVLQLVGERVSVDEGTYLLFDVLSKNKEKVQKIVDLTDHALLKGWEYSVASLSDFKVEIFKWNIFASLGFEKNDRGGVGEVIFRHFNNRIDEKNGEIDALQKELELAYSRVKMTEALLRQADSKEKARRLQAEHMANVDHFHAVKDARDELSNLGEAYQKLYQLLMKVYTDKIGEEFQELYDADIIADTGAVYEDAPAGFRLLYKHGRTDPVAWSFIYSEKEYVEALESFFKMVEPEVISQCEKESQKEEIGLLTTQIIYHIRTDVFLKSAHHRIRTFHAKHDIESGGYKTPWVYTSGGTMDGLLHAYYGNQKGLTKEASVRHTPLDLLTFYVDEMKGLRGSVATLFERVKEKRMLATSPNHAFTLLPGIFLSEWSNQRFSYTWVRDTFYLPAREFYRSVHLTQEQVSVMCAFMEIPPVPCSGSLQEVYARIGGSSARFDQAVYACVPFNSEGAPYYLHSLFEESHLKPKSVCIGDSNWSSYFFHFVVNPRTLEVELWRMDPSGVFGLPMNEWSDIFSHPKKEWELYVNPKEYGMTIDSDLANTTRKV